MAHRLTQHEWRPLEASHQARVDARTSLKWAYKLSPAISSDLTADCFDLAREIRELDMRAAPYDLQSLGYEPVTIETPAGKATYVAAQHDLTARAQVLRHRLIEACDTLLAATDAA